MRFPWGAYRDRMPIYASSLVLPQPEDYARQALAVKTAGWAAYKPHPPGQLNTDLAAYALCREAVGPDFPLMADPVASYAVWKSCITNGSKSHFTMWICIT
jgi:L-alanine-DL-glutamate epimerase-like enolase superfamily enzyme